MPADLYHTLARNIEKAPGRMLDLGRVRIGHLWFKVAALFNSLDFARMPGIFVQAWSADVPADAKKPNGTFGFSFIVQEDRKSAEGLAIRFGAYKVQIAVSLKHSIRATITDFVHKTESDSDLRRRLEKIGFPLRPLPGDPVEADAAAEPQAHTSLYDTLLDISKDLGDDGTLATVQWRGHKLRISGCDTFGHNDDPVFYVMQPHETADYSERVVAYVTVSNKGSNTILEVSPSSFTHGLDKKLVLPRGTTTTREQAKTILVKFVMASIRGYELREDLESKATAAAEPQAPAGDMTAIMREFAFPIEGGYYGSGEIKVPVKLNNRTIEVSFIRLALNPDNLCEVFARVKERGNPKQWVVTVMTDDLRRDKPWFYIVSPLASYTETSHRKSITALKSALTLAARKDIDERLLALARIYANLYLLEASKQGATAAAEPGPRTPLLRSLLLASGREVKLPGLYGDAHVYVTVYTTATSAASIVVTFEAGHEQMEISVNIGDSDTPTESVKVTARKVFPSMSGSGSKKIDIDVLHKEVESWSATKLVRRIVEQVLRVKQDLVKARIWPGSETASASAEPRHDLGLRNERTSVSRVFPKITKIADTLHDSGAAHTDKVYKKAGGVVELTCLDISGITATNTAAITFRFETCVSGAPQPKATDLALTVVRLLASAVPAESCIEVYTFKPQQAGTPLLEKTIKVGLASIESKLTLVAGRDEAHKAAAQLAAVIAYHTLPLVQGLASKLGAPDVE